MAMTQSGLDDQQGRRRPFSTWVKKKLNTLKGTSSGESRPGSKPNKTKKRPSKNNNPYPESGYIGNRNTHRNSHQSFTSTARSGVASATSIDRAHSTRTSGDDRAPPTAGTRSTAATVSTEQDVPHSMLAGASSTAGTSRTAHGGIDSSRRGGDSTFSSPAPSIRSLTTTLTTIQSLAAPGAGLPTSQAAPQTAPSGSQAIHFMQPFPPTPASAIPAHLTPSTSQPSNPTTYSTATANNLLTDNASILTLASSSKRRRRRSLDTDASVRALAPSSLFGGSRESLPLSVLSANIDGASMLPTTPGLQHGGSRIGVERASIYSTSGIYTSERNSMYAKPLRRDEDGASVRSGLFGHGKADSVSGSIGGLTGSLASPREDVLREGSLKGREDKENEGKAKDVDDEEIKDK